MVAVRGADAVQSAAKQESGESGESGENVACAKLSYIQVLRMIIKYESTVICGKLFYHHF